MTQTSMALALANGDDRGLVQDNTLVSGINEGICCAQVNSKITGEQTA